MNSQEYVQFSIGYLRATKSAIDAGGTDSEKLLKTTVNQLLQAAESLSDQKPVAGPSSAAFYGGHTGANLLKD